MNIAAAPVIVIVNKAASLPAWVTDNDREEILEALKTSVCVVALEAPGDISFWQCESSLEVSMAIWLLGLVRDHELQPLKQIVLDGTDNESTGAE